MIEQRIDEHYTVLSVSGKLMGGPETSEFYTCISELNSRKVDNLILDLGDVRWINSAGIGALIASFVSFKNRNGTIKFVNLSPKVKDIFTITKLSTVLEIYDSVENAKK